MDFFTSLVHKYFFAVTKTELGLVLVFEYLGTDILSHLAVFLHKIDLNLESALFSGNCILFTLYPRP